MLTNKKGCVIVNTVSDNRKHKLCLSMEVICVMRLKELREKAGVSQERLATELGYKYQSAISMIENGERQLPSEKLPLLAKVLNCSIEELFETGKVG